MARTKPWLAALARRMGANASEVEELVQDTWLAATVAPPRAVDGSLEPWLATLMRHRVVDLRRAQRRRSRLHLLDEREVAKAVAPRSVTDAFAAVRGREVLNAVRSAIAGLPEPYQDVLYLHLFEEMQPAELARHLGIGRVVVRVRLFRGLRRLRRALPDSLALILIALLARNSSGQATTFVAGVAVAAVLGAALLLPGSDAAGGSPPAFARHAIAAAEISPKTVAAAELAKPDAASRQPSVTMASPRLRVYAHDELGRPLPSVGLTLAPAPGADALVSTRHGVTDAGGAVSFAVPRTDAGRWLLRSDRGAAIEVDLHSGSRDVTLNCPAGSLVRGRVVDGQGRPLLASVWLSANGNDAFTGQDVARTAEDGTFELRNVQPGTLLAVRAPGHGRLPARPVLAGDLGTLVLAEAGGALVGGVFDAQGIPVVDATVLVGEAIDGASPRVVGSWLADLAPPYRLRTDEDGAFLVDGLEPGQHPVVVRSPGLVPVCATATVAAGRAATLRIDLAAGSSLRGRVVDAEGVPLAGVEVRCRCDIPVAANDANTDAAGWFEFLALPSGALALTVRPRDGEVVERMLDLAIGNQTVEVQVARWFEHTGEIVGAGGRHLAGWELSLPREMQRSMDPPAAIVVADAAGGWRLRAPRDTSWAGLRIRPPTTQLWIPAGDLVRREAFGSLVVRVPSESVPSSQLRLVLRDDHARPLAHAPVWMSMPCGEDLQVGVTDGGGRVQIGPLFPDVYHLVAEAPDAEQPPIELPPLSVDAAATRTIELASLPTGRVAFSLCFGDGVPRAPIVTVSRRGQKLKLSVGRTSVGSQVLPAGQYTLHAIGDDFVWVHDLAFEVRANETTHVESLLRRAVRSHVSLRSLPPDCFGGLLVGRFVDRQTGATLYRFELPLDARTPPPLSAFLPVGSIRMEATAASGATVLADFEMRDLTPTYRPRQLDFLRP